MVFSPFYISMKNQAIFLQDTILTYTLRQEMEKLDRVTSL